MGEKENHPWLYGFSLASGIAVLALLWAGFSDLKEPIGIELIIIAVVTFIGGSWISKKSDNFHKWSSLSDRDKFLGYLFLLPGVLLGFFIVFALMAIGIELNHRD